jgi:hypothetical protein
MLLFGLIGTDERSYLWSTIVAAGVAWIAAGVLARFGDRGVATGVALSSGAGLAIAGLVIVITWAGGQWPLW